MIGSGVFLRRRLAFDAVVAALAFGYAVWTIAGSGYEFVYKGVLLLLGGIPVYLWIVYRERNALAPVSPAVRAPEAELEGTTR